jgi:hypothetical protein
MGAGFRGGGGAGACCLVEFGTASCWIGVVVRGGGDPVEEDLVVRRALLPPRSWLQKSVVSIHPLRRGLVNKMRRMHVSISFDPLV